MSAQDTTRDPHAHALLRIACCLWLTALDSGLTPSQLTWLRKRLTNQTVFTPAELAKIQAPLHAWATRRGFSHLLE